MHQLVARYYKISREMVPTKIEGTYKILNQKMQFQCVFMGITFIEPEPGPSPDSITYFCLHHTGVCLGPPRVFVKWLAPDSLILFYTRIVSF